MEKIYRLKSSPQGRCAVGINPTKSMIEINLYSYQTKVLSLIKYKAWDYFEFYCNGLYSRTTSRHISLFTAEFCGRTMLQDCNNRDEYGFVCKVPADIVMERVSFYEWGYQR